MRRALRHLRRALPGLLLVQAVACAENPPQVRLKDRVFTVELAQTREEQALGLMFRDELPRDHGMLFIFGGEAPRSFWMRNTRIPLDILYFDGGLALVSVARNARPCAVRNCPGYPSAGPAQYVLELNAGLAEELALRPGDRLELLFQP